MTSERNTSNCERFIQSPELSANTLSISSTIDEYNENELSQQLRTTDVTVNLFDCMQCYVKIPRCKIEDHIPDFNLNSQTNVDPGLQEYREEQEIVSQIQINQTISESTQEEEEEEYVPLNYIDDYNPMNTMIIIDLPWPQNTE
ncbi:unnamed protein product [Rotaria sp. Silwood1]|nr:unnamed protein product [Rotaria sp. Silwood1]CAF1610751.1 unnamed protein product [Rotaria sp. Silwood1]CAF3719263.1 unnamed protein product [Rotaria sp. Silwood1]CAF4823646.1 unnamed protein product [Rotaria sp. Silwood1]CAF5023029.1 unnamed protein product [Rotaria sp. Silwood1]